MDIVTQQPTTLEAIFKQLCPNCGGDISSTRLVKGLPCENCLKEDIEGKEALCRLSNLKGLKGFCNLNEEYEEWEKTFRKYVGFEPWELQKFWAKKLLLKRSFALLAPTGIGKTSWGFASAIYFAKHNKKTYIILPTKLLVLQSYEKLKDKLPAEDLLVIGIEESKKEKDQNKERLANGQFKILVTTSMFLYKNVDLIPRDFSFIFVDDVDSFLKTAKNIDKALYLLGFEPRDIELTMKYIRMRRNVTEENAEEINSLREQVKRISKKAKGVMVVSSATSNPKSERIRLFKELLSFDVGRPVFYLRNVEDVYEDVGAKQTILDSMLVEKVKQFGDGGLVFVSSDYGKEKVDELKELLNKHGISSESYENFSEEVLERYKNREIQVLIGISSYRNPLARGLDIPEVIRYAIFYGVPKIVVSLDLEGNVKHILLAISTLRPLIARDKELEKWTPTIDKWMKELTKLGNIANPPKDRVEQLREEIKRFILSEEIIKKINSADDVTLRQEDGKWYLVVADVTGYLQASGRTSRLFVGGITKGLSYVLVDDKKVFNNLIRKLRWWFSSDVVFKQAQSVDFGALMEEIDNDRERVRRKEGRRDDFLKPVLVIVESPHKARTIANFFGKPISRSLEGHELYEVITEDKYVVITASFGHVFDLNKEVGYYGVLESSNNGRGKYVPVYETIEGKESIVNAIREASKEFEQILIATDPDTEGEKISWDLKNLCSVYAKNIKRMEFHEVTKRAILNALREHREVDENLVKAQVVRRISDRWVGFELSQLIQRLFGRSNLSAGRVQTPVLGWVIERAKESQQKKYVVTISKDGLDLKFEFEEKYEAEKFFNEIKVVKVTKGEEKRIEKSPLPPYTTDVVLKDASEKYKLSVSRTMEVLQDLFERGFITYHRTDSTRVSDFGMNVAKEYISETFGEEFFKPRTWGEGGAHECIRPTRALDIEDIKAMIYSGELEGFTKDHIAIYDLIFKRFIASQMKNVVLKGYDVKFEVVDKTQEVEVYEEIIEEGFNKVFPIKLVRIPQGTIEVSANKFMRAIPKVYPFTQGSLVEEMKKRGLGRPSTYATIVSRLLERGYVIERNGYLLPTTLGEKVYNFFNSDREKFKFVSEDFTRELEVLMDKVESGEEDYQQILRSLKAELEKI
ncbi:MAG: reverse gyrase [Fervidobacterium pennivorans]|uniref:Reverse gyrase n=1 Tax=Fervidobacterium pennivorans TaxID=93466 RepID=A0A172T128_FERPE|nr:reverse gyrase [Fervidobacterium pennivorans]ANE40711.1 reverse gyrase [Fervidobacterium pennivorans]